MKIQPPNTYQVKGFAPEIERQYQHKLLSMGFVPGALVVAHRLAPLGDPVELVVGQSHIWMRQSELAMIIFEEVSG